MKGVRAIQWLNFFLADVRDGIGPFLNVYLLARHHWQPGDIGVAVGVSLLVSVFFQTPVGVLIDKTKFKRLIVVIASVLMIVSSVAMAMFPNYLTVIGSQFIMGLASTVFAPAISAITLGIVGYQKLDMQVGRNESYNHAGNVTGALLAGTLGYFFRDEWIFYLNALLALLAIFSVLQIKDEMIDNTLARGGSDGSEGTTVNTKRLFFDRQFLIFSASIVLFHFSNAAMLPLAGQYLSIGHTGQSSLMMGACIVLAQLVMVPVANYCGYFASRGRKPVLLLAFAVLVIRGVLYIFFSQPYIIIGIQVLDGLAAGIIGVLTILVIADLTRGKGIFNTAQGAIVTAVGIGAALSNVISGYLVQFHGYRFTFGVLSVIAVFALALLAIAFKEPLSKNINPGQ